ncbi:hypothetical protein H4R35_005041 [Dimargaris xerosporica]|nr:hypothetical protein H4R35_005041 [Dimargaris xerosporica]
MDQGPLASLSENVLVDSIDDASPKVIEAVLPVQFSEDQLTPLDRLSLRSQSSFPFLRVWAAREIKNLLHQCSTPDVLGTLFPVAFQLSTDKDRFVRETMALDLTPLVLYYYQHGFTAPGAPKRPSGEGAVQTQPLNDQPSPDADPGEFDNPITHTLFHDWLETMLLDPSLIVVDRVQATLLELRRHLSFDLYHTEVIHHTILGLAKTAIKSRPPSIDGLAESLKTTSPGAFEPCDSDERILRRKSICLRLIRALVSTFGAALKPAVFVPTIEKTAQDTYFEVRRDTALTIGALVHAVSYDLVLETLFPVFQHLIQDLNWQVRQAAARVALPEIAQVLMDHPTRGTPTTSPNHSLQLPSGNTSNSNATWSASGSPIPFIFGTGLTGGAGNSGTNSPAAASNVVAGNPAGATPHLPPPPTPITAKQWVALLQRLLDSREVSYPVQTAVFGVIGRLMVAFARMDKVKDVLIRHYLTAVYSSMDMDVMPTPEIIYHCAYNFPAVLTVMGAARWDELSGAYLELTRIDHFDVRKTLAHSLHEVAKLLGPNHCEQYLEPVFSYFLVDMDEVQLAVISHLHEFLQCLHDQSRNRCLPPTIEVFQHEGSNWRAREIMAQQIAPLCRLYPAKTVVRHLLPLAVHWAADPVAAVREAAAGAFPVVFDMTKEDPGLQVQFFESMIQFRGAGTFRARLFFIQICEALLTQQVDPTDFEQFFLPSLLTLASDPVSNVRIAVARTLRRLLLASHQPLDTQVPANSLNITFPLATASGGSQPLPALSPPELRTALSLPPASSVGADGRLPVQSRGSSGEGQRSMGAANSPALAPTLASAGAVSECGGLSTKAAFHWTATRSQLITELIATLRTDDDRDVLYIVKNLPNPLTTPLDAESPTEPGAEFLSEPNQGTLPPVAVTDGESVSDPQSEHSVSHSSNAASTPATASTASTANVATDSTARRATMPSSTTNTLPSPSVVSARATRSSDLPGPSPATTSGPPHVVAMPAGSSPGDSNSPVIAAPTPRGALELNRPTFSLSAFSFRRKKSASSGNLASLASDSGSSEPSPTSKGEKSSTLSESVVAEPTDRPRASQSFFSRISSLPSLLENPLADVKFSSPGRTKARNNRSGTGDDSRSASDPMATKIGKDVREGGGPGAADVERPVLDEKMNGTVMVPNSPSGTTALSGSTTPMPSPLPLALPRLARTPSPHLATANDAAAASLSSKQRVRRIHSSPLTLASEAPDTAAGAANITTDATPGSAGLSQLHHRQLPMVPRPSDATGILELPQALTPAVLSPTKYDAQFNTSSFHPFGEGTKSGSGGNALSPSSATSSPPSVATHSSSGSGPGMLVDKILSTKFFS